MDISGILSFTGLVLDIVGIIAIFFFGLPPEVSRGGVQLLGWGVNEKAVKKAKYYDFISTFALLIVIAGFTLQAIAQGLRIW